MKEFAFEINIDNIRVETIENSSALNIGRNFLKDFDNLSKTNQGLGTISGDENVFPANTNYVHDSDGLDMWFGHEETELTEKTRCSHDKKQDFNY